MAKRPTLSNITSLTNSSGVNAINSNWDSIQEAFDNTLSLDGSTPNAMNADLDLNGNALLNVRTIDADNLTLDGQTITDISAVPEWRGAWLTGTDYAKRDMVKTAGNVYICLIAHTSGTFSTDLTNLNWELMVSKGDSGAGTGDLVSTNNLSDVANAATARSNLGLGTVATESTVPVSKGGTGATDAATARTNLSVQASDATLTSLSGLSLVQGDILYATAADTLTRLAKGTAGQVLQINSGETAPEWVDPSSWILVSSSSTWTGGSQTISGLGVYSRVMIVGSRLVADTADYRRLRVGSGGSLLTGNIYGVVNGLQAGLEMSSSNTIERSFSCVIERFNTTDAAKPVIGNGSAVASSQPTHILSSSVFNRIQIANQSGSITSGTLYVWGQV